MINRSGKIILLAAIMLGASHLASAQELLTWDKCVETADLYHPDLKAAKYQVDTMTAAKGVTLSNYLPQISLNAAAQKGMYSQSTSGAGSGTEKTVYSYGATASQLLFDGLKTVFDLKGADKSVAQALYQYLAVSSTVRYNLKIAYILVLTAQEQINVTADIVQLMKKNYDFVKMRYNAGREHLGSLKRSKAGYMNAEFLHLQAKQNYAIYQKQLRYCMGMKVQEPLKAAGTIAVAVDVSQTPDCAELVKSNPNLLQVVKQREAAEYSAKSALAAFSPQISLFGSYTKSDSEFPPQAYQWTAGIKATYPIFQGGQSYYQYNKSKAQESQIASQVLSTEQTLVFKLEQKWNTLVNNLEAVKISRAYLDAAGERLKIAQAQYNLGLIVYDNWILIQDDYVNQKQGLLNAQANAMSAEADWLYAKGVTLKDEH